MRRQLLAVSVLLAGLLAGGAAHAAADLSVRTFTATVTGNTVSYRITVCNGGDATSPAGIFLTVYNNRTSAPACNQVGDLTGVLPAIAPDGCVTIPGTVSRIGPGSYTAWAFADSACRLAETNETDNTRSANYIVSTPLPVPDYVVRRFTATVSGNDVVFVAEVCNDGQTDPTAVEVEFYFNRTAAPTCTSFSTASRVILGGLAAGACKTERITGVFARPGSYTAWARVDADCRIAESNETNNNRSATFTIASRPAAPDIYVSTFTGTVVANDVTFKSRICNKGGSALKGISAELYLDRTAAPKETDFGNIFFSAGGAITSGGCLNLGGTGGFSLTNVGAGTYTSWLLADSVGAYNEPDEANNAKSVSYTVSGVIPLPDINVRSFTAKVTGTTTTYTAVVCNDGAASINNPFTLALYYDRPKAPACAEPASVSRTITRLAASACRTETFTRTASLPGAHKSWIFADRSCVRSETNEVNNIKSASVTVPVDNTKPELRVRSLTSSVTGGKVTYTTTICNESSTAAPSFNVRFYVDQLARPKCGEATPLAVDLGLAANTCETFSFDLDGLPAGTYRSHLFLDGACAVAEGSEANNIGTTQFRVRGDADISVETWSATVSGGTSTYAIKICNVGTALSRPFEVKIWFNRTTAPGCATASPDVGGTAAPVVIDGLPGKASAPANCIEGTGIVIGGEPSGNLVSWILADATCVINENLESDNVRFLRQTRP